LGTIVPNMNRRIAMTALRHRLLDDLQRRGLAPRTQPCDIEAVKHLSPHDRRAPDQLNEEEIRQYFLDLLHEKKVAESTFRIHLYGIRFFDEITRQRPWPVLTRMRPRHSHKRPVVLSPREVRSLLASVVNPTAGMCLRMIDACGLRLREGTPLQVADIDPDRMLVLVRQGTGGQDRLVPLAARTLELWRVDWPRAHPRPWWFPARDQQTPLPATTLQQTFTLVVRQSGLAKDASIHTLRHSYATHLLERGISWRVIQARLGHQRPRTTARDTHLTANTFDVVQATINALMADLYTGRSPGMPEVADVFRRDGPDDRARFGEDLLPSHRRAMDAIISCRTEAFGGHLWPGDHCGHEPYADHSCRHRSGPTCHHQDTEAWLAERRQERLPVPDVHVVCTVPHERGEGVRCHPQDLYDILIRAAAPARITLAADPHDVGGRIGGWCGLHTWTRTLASHPHVHGLVPAGGVTADRTAWRPARSSYVVPVHALSKRFRGLFRALVPQERPDLRIPEAVWTRGWVVYGKPAVHSTEPILNDLGRYVHQVALTNHRLLSSEENQVCCRDQDSQDQRWQTMTLPAQECIRRLLQQVLPQGFHNVRYDGLWSPVHRPLRHQLQLGLAGYAADPPPPAPEPAPQATDAWCPPVRAGHLCPACGQGLRVVIRLLPRDQRGPP
jgi:site-specific recombinase XerD